MVSGPVTESGRCHLRLSGAIEQYAYDGTHLGTWHDSDGVNGIDFPQQINPRGKNVLAAGFSSPAGIYEYDSNGAQINYWAPGGTGLRGVYALGNGKILFTNSQGVHTFDPDTGDVVDIVSGVSAQYINPLGAPEPTSMALLAIGGLALLRRRRA